MEFPTIINWISHFPFKGLLVVVMFFFTFIQNLIEHSVSKHWRLIRCHVLLHLIWVCTVLLCPTNRMLGLYELNYRNDFFLFGKLFLKVSKGEKIRIRYNQVPHLTQDTNGKVLNSVRHHKREPRVSPFPAGDHKAHINRRAQRHSKRKTVTQKT